MSDGKNTFDAADAELLAKAMSISPEEVADIVIEISGLLPDHEVAAFERELGIDLHEWRADAEKFKRERKPGDK
jgi:hypothetical protein